jgi:hypothetical protein
MAAKKKANDEPPPVLLGRPSNSLSMGKNFCYYDLFFYPIFGK